MCMMNTPKMEPPKVATEMASTKLPDTQTASGAGSMQRRRQLAASGTVLTSGSGVAAPASTQKKTLLGE
jgi:hypothetical protein